MKITKVEVFRLPTANSKQNSPIGCRIHTDAGICGDGEAGMAYGVGGSAASIQKTAESILETKRITVELLAADTGRSAGEIEEALAADTCMNAGEAIAFGLCDRIEASITGREGSHG